jgi:hypothetical protein
MLENRNISINIGTEALVESQAVWAPWLSQNLFITYILAVGSSNPLLVHSLIVW